MKTNKDMLQSFILNSIKCTKCQNEHIEFYQSPFEYNTIEVRCVKCGHIDKIDAENWVEFIEDVDEYIATGIKTGIYVISENYVNEKYQSLLK